MERVCPPFLLLPSSLKCHQLVHSPVCCRMQAPHVLLPLLQPVYWEHDHALYVYPMPDALVLADAASAASHNFDTCSCVNPVCSWCVCVCVSDLEGCAALGKFMVGARLMHWFVLCVSLMLLLDEGVGAAERSASCCCCCGCSVAVSGAPEQAGCVKRCLRCCHLYCRVH